MKPHAIKNFVAVLFLLMAMAILAVGCYWGGPPPPEYPGYGYYEGYSPGFFETDVIIDVDRHREDFDRRHEISHMPARRLPPPAPRPMPHPHPEHIRR